MDTEGLKFPVGTVVRVLAPKAHEGATGVVTFHEDEYVYPYGVNLAKPGEYPSTVQFNEGELEALPSTPTLEYPSQEHWCGLCGTYATPGKLIPCYDGESHKWDSACPKMPPMVNQKLTDTLTYTQQASQSVEDAFELPPAPTVAIKSDGGSTAYYKLPEDATELGDLIAYKRMSFDRGNIFKAAYRLGEKAGTDVVYDLNKIIFFAEEAKRHYERYGYV